MTSLCRAEGRKDIINTKEIGLSLLLDLFFILKAIIMIQVLAIYFLFLILIFHPSCKGQESPSAKENIKERTQNNKVKNKPSDYDPYFAETQSITKSFGPTNITRNVLQDKNGDYWLATWEGIIKYDGKVFTNYTNKDSLRRHRVFTLLEDKIGNLWFGTIGGGIYFYDGVTFTNFTKKDGLTHDGVLCFYEDKKGNIWIGTQAGINRYDGKNFEQFIIDGGTNNNDINAIVEDNKGELWIGTKGKAFIFDGKNFNTITYDNNTPFTNVRTIIKDKKGNMWLGGNDGLRCYQNNTFTKVSNEFTGYIYEDSKGSIWTSTTVNGDIQNWVLNRYDAYLLPLELIKPNVIKPEVGMLFGIVEDTDGDIWFGNVRGVGRYDGKDFEYFKEN